MFPPFIFYNYRGIMMDKKLFICHVFGSDIDYAVLADTTEEAKKIVTDFVNKHYCKNLYENSATANFEVSSPPYRAQYTINNIVVMDVENVKQNMIDENKMLEVL